MEYEIVTGRSTEDLKIEVKKLLSTGWRIEGGIAYNPDIHHYYQVMVLEMKKMIRNLGD